MALIVCETCNKEISDEAKKCPLCGAKTLRSKKVKRHVLIGVILGIVVILLVSVFVFIALSGKAEAVVETVVTQLTK